MKQVDGLTEEEKKELQGGFKVQRLATDEPFFATNKNCNGGGWWDTNTNCTSECKGCSATEPGGVGQK